MSKVYEALKDPYHKCSLCGDVFPWLLIKNEATGEEYCSEKCKITDEDIMRVDHHEHAGVEEEENNNE